MLSSPWVVISTLIMAFIATPAAGAGYAPTTVQCPANSSLIREATDISDAEKKWVAARRPKANEALVTFLKHSNLTYDAASLVNGSDISIALAFSGGGYRAMLNGAGQLAATDERTEFASGTGLGGLLQSSTYIAALSGGSWMLGSLLFNNFSSVDEVVLQNDNDLWNLTESRQLVNQSGIFGLYWDVFVDDLSSALTHMNYYSDGIEKDISGKEKAGYNSTLTDYWGRGLSRQLFTSEDEYAVFTDLRSDPLFVNHEIPFPLVTAVGRKPGSVVYNLNSTEIEFNPFEMGSFDPSLNTFTDLKYIGSEVSNGIPKNSEKCVVGFENAGFVLGTSSSLFNQFLNTLVCEDCNFNFFLKIVIRWFLNTLSKEYEDVAQYSPNPFYHSQYASSNNISESDTLYLIDGGLTGETIPLSTVSNKARALDIAFAFDSSNNSPEDWPDGSAIISTYERQFEPQGQSVVFPYVPDNNTFIYNNLTTKPTFFGCDASNLTALVKDGVIPPLVVYIANSDMSFLSNTSTYQLTYTDSDKKAMIRNGIEQTTRNNGTLDQNWRTCVACAIVRREEERQGIEQSAQCKQCFSKYCWDGTYATVNSGKKRAEVQAKEEKADVTSGGASTLNIPWLLVTIAAILYM